MAILGFAQGNCPWTPIDITLVPNQDQELEVWLRAEEDFDVNFSSIVFTIRWMDSDDVVLGGVTLSPPFTGLGTSGPNHVDGIYRYQIYSSEVSVLQPGFVGGEEKLYARISILSGSSYFQIADDAFTESVNGLYYTSLNGSPCTGEIYTFSTGGVAAGVAAPGVSVSPNPSAGRSAVVVSLTAQADLNFTLLDPAGRKVWQQARPARSGQHVEQLDMENMADGVYMLQVQINEQISTHRIVLGGGRK